MKFEIKITEEQDEPKKTLRVGIAVDPDLKAEIAKLPTKYFTENTRRFFEALVNEYKKKKAS